MTTRTPRNRFFAFAAAWCAASAGAACLARPADAIPDDLLTVAERSDYRATARYADVMDLLRRLADTTLPGSLPGAGLARLGRMGFTAENREIPLLIIADPPVASAAEAEASGKPVYFAFGNIHAGEVCGKEALPMLAREILSRPQAPENRVLLDHAVIVLAPIYNADGNERVSKDNRPGQVGPEEGMGTRANAGGLDLNRDYTKLVAAETRAMASFLADWRPHLIIDTHTTNGSKHRWTITYESPLHAAAHPAPVRFVRDDLLPDARRRLREAGYESFWYGELSDDGKEWRTYSAQARFGGNYHGLIGRASVLCEAYAYAPYKDRVLATLAFVRACFASATERRDALLAACARADEDTETAGIAPAPDDMVALRHRIAAFPDAVMFQGYAPRPEGEPAATNPHEPRPDDAPADWPVTHYGRFEPTLAVPRPAGYLVPGRLRKVVETLALHGLRMSALEDAASLPATLEIEEHTITAVARAEQPFQGVRLTTFDTERARSVRRFEGTPRTVQEIRGERGARGEAPPEWWFIPTAQPLGTLAVILLEPGSEDGLGAWGMLDDATTGEPPAAGSVFPVLRVMRAP